MRCKACNAVFTEDEQKEIDPLTGEASELCSECMGVSNDAVENWFEEDE